jgi:hypothetical protein
MSIYKFGYTKKNGDEYICGYFKTPSVMYEAFAESLLSKWNYKVDDFEEYIYTGKTISFIDDVNDFDTPINWNQLLKLKNSKNDRIIKMFKDYATKYEFEPAEATMNDFLEFLDTQSKEYYDDINDMSYYIVGICELLLINNLDINDFEWLLSEPIEID